MYLSYYHLVNVISLGLAQNDPITRRLLYNYFSEQSTKKWKKNIVLVGSVRTSKSILRFFKKKTY
jgi:hypothetical protein